MNTNFKSTSKSCLQSFFLLSLLLFAACSSDNDEQVQQPQPEKSYPLTIEVTENPMTGDGENSSTRAAITDNSSLNKFYMSYGYSGTATYINMVANKSTEGKWTTEGSWPGAGVDTEVTWYASSVSLSNQSGVNAFYPNEGNPYISFSVEEYAETTKDLLVAKTSGTWNGTAGNIAFTFDHACAALRFEIKKSSNLSAYTVNVSNIKLCKVIKLAKYFWETNAWVDYATPTRTEYTLFNGTLDNLGSASYENLNAADDYLFFIPQTLTEWDKTAITSSTIQCYLTIACTISDGGSFNFSGTAYMPFGLTLEKGHKRTVKLIIGKNSLLNSSGTKIVN